MTDFDYEVVVGEDCSTDGTARILADYQRVHPDRLRVSFNERNLGPAANYDRILRTCRGQYITLLDGDDYWLAPHEASSSTRSNHGRPPRLPDVFPPTDRNFKAGT